MYHWSKTHPAIPAAPSNRVNQKDTQTTRIKLTFQYEIQSIEYTRTEYQKGLQAGLQLATIYASKHRDLHNDRPSLENGV